MTAEPTDRLASARAHLAAARAPTAAGPAADAESLRTAYLDVLKLAVCDLAGVSTMSVGAMPDGSVMARELRGDELQLRSAGMDWPLQGLTMVGLGRLDDLQHCLEQVVHDGVAGDVIEAGCWRGGASLLMRATLDTLGDERILWVADSFQGFPADEPPGPDGLDLGAFDFLAAPEDEVRATFERLGLAERVELVPGFFQASLPALAGHRWALVRLDADTYEPTRIALECLYPGLEVGGYLVIDDYGSFEGCRRAVDEFRREHGIAEPIEHVDSTCSRWRRTRGGPPPAAVRPRPIRVPSARAPAPRRPIPTARELELERELRQLRDRRLHRMRRVLRGRR